jgi:hypothetical protein
VYPKALVIVSRTDVKHYAEYCAPLYVTKKVWRNGQEFGQGDLVLYLIDMPRRSPRSEPGDRELKRYLASGNSKCCCGPGRCYIRHPISIDHTVIPSSNAKNWEPDCSKRLRHF